LLCIIPLGATLGRLLSSYFIYYFFGSALAFLRASSFSFYLSGEIKLMLMSPLDLILT
jgi:hypothetical protein